MLSSKSKKIAFAVILISAIAFVVYSVKNNRQSDNSADDSEYAVDPQFASYISSFTSGFISSNSTIKIKLSQPFSGVTELNTALKEKYFSFDPSIDGETVWKDSQTLEFIPKESLKAGQSYQATFYLNKLIEVKKELKEFEFRFQTVQQSLQLLTNDLKCYHSNDFNYYSLSGNVATADVADKALVEKTVEASLDSKKLNIKWTHDELGTNHRYVIDSIERPLKANATLSISCNGKALGVDYTGTQGFVIPTKGKFVLLNTRVVLEGDPYVLLNFSNPVDESKTLEGFISIKGLSEVKYIVSNNQVFVYPQKTKTGSYILRVDAGVKDTKGQKLNESSEISIVFSQVNPAVRFTGNGNILPSTNGLTLPFETVNLRAVDVTIVKIYENNVLQFLQNNAMDGSYQLTHVGKRIVKKRVNLGITNSNDLSSWRKFSLDMATLLKAEPGAIYRVSLSFRKSYSSYPCLGNSAAALEMEDVQETEPEEEVSYFNSYNDEYGYNNYYYDEDEDYNWRDRDDPCKSYYYIRSERTVSKNVLASDIGLTLKRGNDGSLFAVINDLITTKPVGNVKIELYDFQKQLIQTETTNAEGYVFIDPVRQPAFVVAKHEKQFAYLRVDDGATLPLSMYDVSGEAIKKGLKGFIYGERGVWRPGDSLFLNFILEDKAGSLPANHPVSFALYNPQKQLYKRLTANKSVDGFYNFAVVTDKNAPTGYWTVEVKLGSIRFNKSIRIESIMPNRLKIDLDFGNDKLIEASKPNAIKLHTNWLTGAIAKNLAVKVNVALTSATTEFPKFKDYNFDDVTTRFDAQNVSVFDGKVDEFGNAAIPLNIHLENNAPGMLRAVFNTNVFEPGGAFSVDRFSLNYSPFSYYAGIKLPNGENNTGILYTGKDHFIEIATVDAKGNPVSRPNLKFEMYKMEWRWWWDRYEYDLANYASDNYHKPVQIQSISSQNGKASVKVNVNENNWGRYLIRVIDLDGGHASSTVTYFDWSNWMDRDGESGDNKILSNMLSFTTNKSKYTVGEEVSVILPSPQNGRALITIENGSKVMEAHWLETNKGSTTFKFKVTPQMAPNAYVHVSLMQPHARTNDLPIRLYGVLPVNIDDPGSHLKPAIKMPAIIEPEKNVSIVVSEENGKEMAFTLAIVDDGLLDITRFKTPNPHPAFYAKEALGVKTWDVYDNVIGAFGADLERILSIGGDGSEMSNDGAKANRFKPMVRFFGPYHLDKGDKKTISFKMPMYVGSVRTMVIAGKNGAYGMAEKTTPVKAPLMILGTLPRVLSVTEEVKLPVSIFGGEKNIGNTEVKIEVNGLLQPLGGNTQNVSVNKNEEKLVLFDLKVKNLTGIAKIKITAKGGGHSATYDMELDVRNPNPFETNGKDYWVDAGKSLNQTYSPFGVAGTNTGALELSTIPPINLEERLNYLITYPHGCVEQTTSQTFAQLNLSEVMELSPERKVNIEANIKGGINELRKFQLSSGGMSYWPGNTEANEWGTSYAGHFLISAEKKGYTLPSGMKKSWISYQQTAAQNFVIDKSKYYASDEQQAYRLYVLALANNPVVGAMNRLREYNQLNNQARWMLAAAYAQIGQLDEANKLIAGLSTVIKDYKVNYYTYGSTERDMAIVLQTLCLLNKKQQAYAQLKKVSEFLSANRWLSTQTTAYALVSVSSFINKYGGSSAMQAKCKLNGEEISVKGKSAVTQIPLTYKGSAGGNFIIENNGSGMLYVRCVNRGKPPIGQEKAANENISATVLYKDMSGNAIDPTEIVQGTNLIISITVKNLGLLGEIENIALSNYIASGWEIHNARMDENEAVLKSSSYTYQDIRDDRVQTYFDLHRNETKTINIMVNASYEGKYYLPGVNVEAMYDNTVYARTQGQWIRVVKANSGVAEK
jgi:alpha-2-macroglobulin